MESLKIRDGCGGHIVVKNVRLMIILAKEKDGVIIQNEKSKFV